MYQPLADLLRPQTLDEVYGQEHILGKGAVLRRLIDSGNIPNMVFYGPSGTGKTTVANIIAKQTNRTLYKLNATTASTADIKEIVAQLDTFMAPNGVLLYLDEIQSFNKKQQQSLLEHIENGKITLIASTTENPYFYVFNAILSRSTVFEFKQITKEAALKALGMPEKAIHLERFNTPGTPVKRTVSVQADGQKVTVRQDGRDREITLTADDESILDAALRQGADLPYACKGGVCATCKCKVLRGEVDMATNYSLEPDELAAGYVLSCQALPLTADVIVDFDAKGMA